MKRILKYLFLLSTLGSYSNCKPYYCTSNDDCSLHEACSDQVCKSIQVLCGEKRNIAYCDNDCVELQTSQFHCGKCGHSCKLSQRCITGECMEFCPPGLFECDRNSCIDTQKSSSHCGQCNFQCNEYAECINGKCICKISTQCGSDCTDLRTDPNHCGKCFNRCGGNFLCEEGQCVCPENSLEGYTLCEKSCVNIRTSEKHCGKCNHECKEQRSCWSGICR